VSGYLLFLPLVGSEASPWEIPHLVRFALLGLAMGADPGGCDADAHRVPACPQHNADAARLGTHPDRGPALGRSDHVGWR
ncbi:MAG: hypothetical protein ACRDUV_20765, partial [Pseudonocardiaceae bacterium]